MTVLTLPLSSLLCPPSPPLPDSSASVLALTASFSPVQGLVQCQEQTYGVKTVFHLPLTRFLRTLQCYYCLTALTLSHLAAAQMTPSKAALSCVMNKSLFPHGLYCTYSLNSQNQHTFPIQISTKNSFVTSSK